MKKFPLIILSLALICMGWYQEVFYYHFVFTGNGLASSTAYIAGISLSLLLGYFAMKKYVVRFGLLLIFSIACTVIGQNQSYSEKKNSYSISTVRNNELTENKQYYRNEIQRVNSEIKVNNDLLPKDLYGRAVLKTNGVDPIKADIAILKAEKKEYESKLLEVSHNLSTGTKQNTAFENLAKDIPFLSPTLLKYIFQVFMSLFIALMAPSGITILSTMNPQVERVAVKKVVEKKKDTTTTDHLEIYVNKRFRDQENPSSLMGRTEILNSKALTSTQYSKYTKLEKSLNLVNCLPNMTIPLVSRSKFIMMMRNNTANSQCISAVL
jgi:hypothetical protein